MYRFSVPLIVLSVLIIMSPCRAGNYLLNGGQRSQIAYTLRQKIQPTAETVTVDLTFVQPQSFQSPTYNQEIHDFTIQATIEPEHTDSWTDSYGNHIIKYSWSKPAKPFDVEVKLTAINRVTLEKINTSAPFPVARLSAEFDPYLKSSGLAPKDDPEISGKAREMAAGSETQFDAVQKILSYIIDHVDYVLTPPDYGARYTFDTGRGNCQNYSHLAAAMMRAEGIPVRIVNGVTLKQPYDVTLGKQVLTLNMAQGRHSWIEVYFPDLGWVPFDPQQTELFVSNRFIRVEIGADNEETVNDGLVRWTRQKGSADILSFEEVIDAQFAADNISIEGKQLGFGPHGLLLQPEVSARFVPVKAPEVKAPPVFTQEMIAAMKFGRDFQAGNTDFPEGINFAFLRDKTDLEGGKVQELKKNFLVETAEYITGRNQYCQIFTLDTPVKLFEISLALQKFGGDGRIWLELREDKDNSPGAVAAKSAELNLNQLSSKPGYFWVNFDFSKQELVLTPDKYWISLGYEGTPVINWFYSYGKPVGPIDGTRYRSGSQDAWDKSVGFEFNYRLTGLTAE